MFENISNQVCAQLLSLIAAYSDQMLDCNPPSDPLLMAIVGAKIEMGKIAIALIYFALHYIATINIT